MLWFVRVWRQSIAQRKGSRLSSEIEHTFTHIRAERVEQRNAAIDATEIASQCFDYSLRAIFCNFIICYSALHSVVGRLWGVGGGVVLVSLVRLPVCGASQLHSRNPLGVVGEHKTAFAAVLSHTLASCSLFSGGLKWKVNLIFRCRIG